MATENETDKVKPSCDNEFASFFSVLQPENNIVSLQEDADDAEEQPDKLYVFDKQNEASKEAEECFICFAMRWKENGIIRDFIDVRENKYYQEQDIDFVCIRPDGTKRTYEVKGDFTETGNMFVEYSVPTYCIDANDRRKILRRHAKLGWMYQSKADYVFYYYSATKVVYLFELLYFSAWVDGMSLRCNFEKRRQAMPFPIRGAKNLVDENKPHGSYYYGMGYIIPLKEIEDMYQKKNFLKIYHIKDKEGI